MSEMTQTARATTGRPPTDSAGSEDGTGWRRAAALAGFAFVASGIVATVLPGAPPASDAAPAKIVAYFRDHAGGVKGQTFVGTIGIVAVLWWFAALWRVMSKAEDGRPRLSVFAALSLAMGVTLAVVAGMFVSIAAFRAGGSVDGIQLLWAGGLVATALAGLPIFGFISAVVLLNHRTGMFPAWTNYVGGLAAVAFAVSSFGAVNTNGVVNACGIVAFLVWCVWIVGLSVYLWRGTETA